MAVEMNLNATEGLSVRRPYMPAFVGITYAGVPHAFHLEGYIVKKGRYFPKRAIGPAMQIFTLRMGMSADLLMKRASGEEKLAEDLESADIGTGGSVEGNAAAGLSPSGFCQVITRGVLADEVQNYPVGMHVAVAGDIGWKQYIRADGSVGRSLECEAIHVAALGMKGVPGQVTNGFGTSRQSYVDNRGEEQLSGYAELLTGEVVGCRGLKTTASGTPFYLFSIKVPIQVPHLADLVCRNSTRIDKVYDDVHTLNCIAWKKKAEHLARVRGFGVGTTVCVTGRLNEWQWKGTTSCELTVCEITMMRRCATPAEEISA